MPSTSLDTTDATELAETQRLARYGRRTPRRVHGPLRRPHPAYHIGALHDDLARFIFLLGGNDGEHFL